MRDWHDLLPCLLLSAVTLLYMDRIQAHKLDVRAPTHWRQPWEDEVPWPGNAGVDFEHCNIDDQSETIDAMQVGTQEPTCEHPSLASYAWISCGYSVQDAWFMQVIHLKIYTHRTVLSN
eukprot:m.125467 g.125467  ORF g.125467 m.125467 type:complete len:119 (+) comp13799_c0_seq5:39-395(+)